MFGDPIACLVEVNENFNNNNLSKVPILLFLERNSEKSNGHLLLDSWYFYSSQACHGKGEMLNKYILLVLLF